MSKNLHKKKGSNNPILNIIGNMCGAISYFFMKPQIKWGTMWTLDFDDEEDL